MLIIYRCIAFVFLLSFFLNASAQKKFPLPAKNYTHLFGHKVWCVHQDAHQKLWIGTSNGLFCYDGFSTRQFSTKDGLEDNEIIAFWGEKFGKLWLRTFNNRLSCIDVRTFKVLNTSDVPDFKMSGETVIHNVAFSDSAIYMINEEGKALMINLRLPVVKHLSISRACTNGLLFMNNKLISVTGDYIRLYSGRDLLEEQKPLLIFQKGEMPILSTLYDSNLFVLTSHSVYKISDSLEVQKIISLPDKLNQFPIFISVLKKDVYLINYNDFFLLYHNGQYKRYAFPNVGGVVPDKDGNYWAVSKSYGLFKIPYYYANINELTPESNTPIVTSFASRSETKTITRDGKTITYDRVSNKAKSQISIGKLNTPILAVKKSKQYIYYFTLDGICIQNEQDGRVVEFSRLTCGAFKGALLIGDTIYIRTISGLYEYRYHQSKIIGKQIFKGRVISFCSNNSGVFFATLNKLYCYNKEGLQATNIPYRFVIRNLMGTGDYILFTNPNHNLVFINTANFIAFKKHLGIESEDNPSEFYHVAPNEILCKTEKHFYYINGENLDIIPIIIPELNISEVTDVQLIDEYLFFTTPQKVISFPLLKNNVGQPPAFDIIKVVYNDSLIITTPSKNTILPANTRSISLSISAPALNTEHLNVQYCIYNQINDQKVWHLLLQNEINLPTQNGQTYYISIQSRIGPSEFCNTQTWTVQISEPFTESVTFFVMIATGLIMLALLGLQRYNIRRFKKKEETLLQEFIQTKNEIKAFNAMMNPHFVFNCLNSIQSLILSNNRERANNYLQKFSKLIRQNIINMNAVYIPLYMELELIKNYVSLEKLRTEVQFEFEICMDLSIPQNIFIPPLLIQPLVENAIKHGLLGYDKSNSFIHINIDPLPKEGLIITVHDNGCGFIKYESLEKPQNGASIGIAFIEKRLNKIKKLSGFDCGILIESKIGIGTKISIRMPEYLEEYLA